jgi:hypothetical protein
MLRAILQSLGDVNESSPCGDGGDAHSRGLGRYVVRYAINPRDLIRNAGRDAA